MGEEELEFLGNCIGKGKVCIPEARVRDMTDYVRPELKKDFRAFRIQEPTGYYRCFIPPYGSVAVHLTSALKKAEPDQVVWSAERVEAFQSLCK